MVYYICEAYVGREFPPFIFLLLYVLFLCLFFDFQTKKWYTKYNSNSSFFMSETSLQQQNTQLKKQLKTAQKWMQSQVNEAEKNIASDTKIAQKVSHFFQADITHTLPESCIQHTISAEIVYQVLRDLDHFDGISVAILYQKALDILIERYIISWYRSFVLKQNVLISPKNHPLEKSLFQVVQKWYTLSTGRLYHLLSDIKNNELSWEYAQYFDVYLETYTDLQKTLLSDEWYDSYEQLVNTGIFWSKRHTGAISVSDIETTRQFLVGNLENKNCIFYKLIQTAEVI